jgi:hypothetical protein
MMHRSKGLVVNTDLRWPGRVPSNALYCETMRKGGCVAGEFRFKSGKMQVSWSPDGAVLSESPFDEAGRRHGLELSRFENGNVEWQVPWVRGNMHGVAKQFDEEGHVLYRSRFTRGQGVDLWVLGDEVVELREISSNERHGIERWGHPRLPYEEASFQQGRRAGIFRRWIGGSLVAGYPKFFIDDNEVSRSAYARARARRGDLPLYRPCEDERLRPILPALKSIWLRKQVRAALMKIPTVDDVVGCGAHWQGPEPMK